MEKEFFLTSAFRIFAITRACQQYFICFATINVTDLESKNKKLLFHFWAYFGDIV